MFTRQFVFVVTFLALNTAWASASSVKALNCAGGNIEVTYKEGFWPFTHDKATFKDKVRKLDLTAGFSITADAYGIESGWVSEGDIVFQLSAPNDYTPYALVLNSRRMKETKSGDKVTIGFSANYEGKFRDYRCVVK